MPKNHPPLVAIALLLSLAGSAAAQWEAGDSGTKASLRGVHNAGGGVAWASGSGGVVLRSEDDGYVWQQCAVPPDGERLDFRGVWAWDANHALALSSGPGPASKLYETTDGCAHWQLVFTNPDATGFWDAIAFRDEQHGMLLGDPVNGQFVIYTTSDGGRHWARDESAGLAANPNEGAFAASNSSLALSRSGKDAYFGTAGPRVFHFHAGSWTASKLASSPTAESTGIFSLQFRDAQHGVAVGGDYKRPKGRENAAWWSADGGANWQAAANPPGGYRSAVEWDQNSQFWIAVGTNGSDFSKDNGKTWAAFDTAPWNALSLPWAVGPDGRIAMLNQSAPGKK